MTARSPANRTHQLRIAVLLLAAVTVALAAVSFYTWAWRGSDGAERARAIADAGALSWERPWTSEDVVRVAPRLWRAVYRTSAGEKVCVLLDLDRFQPGSADLPLGFAGAARVRC